MDEVSNTDLKKDEKKNNKIDDGTEALSSDDNSKEGKKDKKAKKSKKKKSKKEKKKKVRGSVFLYLYIVLMKSFLQKKRKKGKDSENSASLSEESGAEEQVKKLKSVLKQNVAYPSSSTSKYH